MTREICDKAIEYSTIIANMNRTIEDTAAYILVLENPWDYWGTGGHHKPSSYELEEVEKYLGQFSAEEAMTVVNCIKSIAEKRKTYFNNLLEQL